MGTRSKVASRLCGTDLTFDIAVACFDEGDAGCAMSGPTTVRDGENGDYASVEIDGGAPVAGFGPEQDGQLGSHGASATVVAAPSCRSSSGPAAAPGVPARPLGFSRPVEPAPWPRPGTFGLQPRGVERRSSPGFRRCLPASGSRRWWRRALRSYLCRRSVRPRCTRPDRSCGRWRGGARRGRR